jgi:hypothetical protein
MNRKIRLTEELLRLSSKLAWLRATMKWLDVTYSYWERKRNNNSFQSIHDVFLYRVEHDKKNLIVNLLYEFARTIDEKFRRISSLLSSKKWRRLSSSCKKNWKNVLIVKIKRRRNWQFCRHCINAKDMTVSISLDIVDEISILINITHSFHIILYAEIRFLIMKYWALISNFSFSMSKRIWFRWRKKKTKRLIFNHHLRLRSWLFLRFIFLRTRFHLQSHLQLHLLYIQLRIQLRIQSRIQLSMHLSIHLSMHLHMISLRMLSLRMLLNIQIDWKNLCIHQANQLRLRMLRLARWKIMIWRFTLIDIFNQNHRNERSCDLLWIN